MASLQSWSLQLLLIVGLSILLTAVHAATVANCVQAALNTQSTAIVGLDYPALTGKFVFFTNQSADGSGYRYYGLQLSRASVPCNVDSIVINPGSDAVTLKASISDPTAVGQGSWKKQNGGLYFAVTASLALSYDASYSASAMVDKWFASLLPYVSVVCTERNPGQFILAAGKLRKVACPTTATVPVFPSP